MRACVYFYCISSPHKWFRGLREYFMWLKLLRLANIFQIRAQISNTSSTLNPTMNLSRRPLRSVKVTADSAACILCQWRTFSTSYRRLVEKPALPLIPTPIPSPLADAPRSYGKSVDEFTPKPLSRPIGLSNPPQAGENRGIDTRTWKQRRADFVDYDKHLVRREELYLIPYSFPASNLLTRRNLESKRYQLLTSENGATCACTKGNPSSPPLDYSKLSEHSTSPISGDRHYIPTKSYATLPPHWQVKYPSSVYSVLSGQKTKRPPSPLRNKTPPSTNLYETVGDWLKWLRLILRIML